MVRMGHHWAAKTGDVLVVRDCSCTVRKRGTEDDLAAKKISHPKEMSAVTTDFERSDEVRVIAENLIDKFHPHLSDAKDVIEYYLRYGTAEWAGKAKKCTAFERHVTGRNLFIFINSEAWEALKHPQRVALIDHELCHFVRENEEYYDDFAQRLVTRWADAKDPDSWHLRDHDVEEFSEVIARHGLWEQGIERFAVAVRNAPHQVTLFEDLGRREGA
jgi:hypothetical protein